MNIWILNHYAGLPSAPGGTRHFDFARCMVERQTLAQYRPEHRRIHQRSVDEKVKILLD